VVILGDWGGWCCEKGSAGWRLLLWGIRGGGGWGFLVCGCGSGVVVWLLAWSGRCSYGFGVDW
jgi:hypothetical protein